MLWQGGRCAIARRPGDAARGTVRTALALDVGPRVHSRPAGPGVAVDKLRTLDELAAIAAAARAAGKDVVLAHGVFDILHIGHKRHLETGKLNGDILIVTLTADDYVNKGPGRPIFPEKLRAEMLSALDVVDYVGISPSPGGELVIEKIRPSVYIKGAEYSDEKNDLTGRIKTETACVERFGGRVVFTDDITFSSSSLANRALQVFPEDAAEYLANVRGQVSFGELQAQLRALQGMRCLVVGDTILDEYIYVEPLGKPAKENIIATRYLEREMFSGGVIATANTTAQFCNHIDLVTLLGHPDNREEFIRHSLHPHINLVPFYREGAPTTVKSRLVDPGYMKKLIEIAYLEDAPLPPETQAEINGWIDAEIEKYDMVMINDFGHGLIDEELIEIMCRKARFLAISAQTNSANRGFNLVTRYPRADVVCIDEPEARLAAADRHSPIEAVIRRKLETRMDCRTFIVTHGKLGCVVSAQGGRIEHIPALIDEALDTMGAGDAFFAVASPLIANGCDPFMAAFMGNAVGAMKIRIVGHRHQISDVEILKYLASLLK